MRENTASIADRWCRRDDEPSKSEAHGGDIGLWLVCFAAQGTSLLLLGGLRQIVFPPTVEASLALHFAWAEPAIRQDRGALVAPERLCSRLSIKEPTYLPLVLISAQYILFAFILRAL